MKGRRNEIAGIFAANVVSYLVFLVVLFLFHQDDWSRSMIALFFVFNVILDILARLAIWASLKKMWKSGLNQRNVLLVGYSRAAEEYIDRVLLNPQWGFNIRGILDDKVQAGTTYKGIKVLGRIDNLMVILPENHLDEITITLSLTEYYRLEKIVALCEKSGVHTKFIPDYNNIIPTKPYTEDVLGLPVINIRYVPLSNAFPAATKRLMDIVGSILAIAISSPVMIYGGRLIRLGYAIRYVASASVIHSHNYSNGEQFHRYFDNGVSQAMHPEIFKGVPSAREGKKLVSRTRHYLSSIGRGYLIPHLYMQSFCKLAGFRLGKAYRILPKALVMKCTWNKDFWSYHGSDD